MAKPFKTKVCKRGGQLMTLGQLKKSTGLQRLNNAPRQSKYLNKKTEVDGISFHSKKEANRYLELKLMQASGMIKNLVLQPRFYFFMDGKPIKANDKGSRQICYVADFQYEENGKTIVEDVKSSFTEKDPVFRIKKALFDTQYVTNSLIFRQS